MKGDRVMSEWNVLQSGGATHEEPETGEETNIRKGEGNALDVKGGKSG